MKLKFGFGTCTEEVELPEENLIAELHESSMKHKLKGEKAVKSALEHPIGSKMLRDIVQPGEKIAIVTSDITRPMPTDKVMPALRDELCSAGVRAADITLVLALGSHRGHTEEERRKLAGERAFNEITCVDSDPLDCISFGKTKRGTPIDVTRIVAEADRRICLGNIEYHYFVGYSGGAKAIMPGVSSRSAIQRNHSAMTDDSACAGKLEGNPIREDLEEAVSKVGVDFILNVVLDEHKEFVFAAAGDVTAAHREGCKYLDRMYTCPIPKRADIVLVSQGGAPKDLNLYQTQKALDNAKHAVRDGGIVILIGSCREGMGEGVSARNPESLIERIEKDFQLGGHKAAAIAMVLKRADIFLVSDMEDDFVRSIFMSPFASAQEALDEAFRRLGKDASVISMPYGGSTLPKTVS